MATSILLYRDYKLWRGGDEAEPTGSGESSPAHGVRDVNGNGGLHEEEEEDEEAAGPAYR